MWFLPVVGVLLVNCGIIGFITLEMNFWIIVLVVGVLGSSYERSGSMIYLSYFSIVIGVVLVSELGWGISSILVLAVLLANIPVYSMHMWLPNVHVEAPLVGSIFLAGIGLNLSGLFYYWISLELILSLISLMIVVSNLNDSDNKVVVAGSSIYHIGLGVLCINMIWLLSYSHMLISPFIFLGVYMSYLSSSSRNQSCLGIGLLMVNLGFPLLGGFFSELYMVITVISLLLYLYYFVGVVYLINLVGSDGNLSCLLVLMPYFIVI